MKTKSIVMSALTVAIVAGLGIVPAAAQHAYVAAEQSAQSENSGRIQQAVAEGRITPQEGSALQSRENVLLEREQRGFAWPHERIRLKHQRSKLKADIDRAANKPPVVQNTSGIDRSLADIRARIQQGVASGRITRQESDVLHRHETDIRNEEQRVRADGVVSPRERDQQRQRVEALRAEVERMINNPRDTSGTPGIDRSLDQIRERIQQGVAAGRITRQEAEVLHRREQDIRHQEQRFRADGGARPRELEQLGQQTETLRADVERAIENPQPTTNAPGIDARMERVTERIEEGVRAGTISRREGRQLDARAQQIEQREAEFNADGNFTREERREIRRELDQLLEEINQMTGGRK